VPKNVQSRTVQIHLIRGIRVLILGQSLVADSVFSADRRVRAVADNVFAADRDRLRVDRQRYSCGRRLFVR